MLKDRGQRLETGSGLNCNRTSERAELGAWGRPPSKARALRGGGLRPEWNWWEDALENLEPPDPRPRPGPSCTLWPVEVTHPPTGRERSPTPCLKTMQTPP